MLCDYIFTKQSRVSLGGFTNETTFIYFYRHFIYYREKNNYAIIAGNISTVLKA